MSIIKIYSFTKPAIGFGEDQCFYKLKILKLSPIKHFRKYRSKQMKL